MYAVIFSAQQSDDTDGYGEMAAKMVELGSNMPGFIGIESARNPDGFGITVSYWETEEDIARWKAETEHLVAQQRGRDQWYSSYTTRVAEVTREYSHPD